MRLLRSCSWARTLNYMTVLLVILILREALPYLADNGSRADLRGPIVLESNWPPSDSSRVELQQKSVAGKAPKVSTQRPPSRPPKSHTAKPRLLASVKSTSRSTTSVLSSTSLKPASTSTTPALTADRLEALLRVKNVKLFQPFLTPLERWIVLDLLGSIDRVFRYYNVTYILYGGTLLGSHRHHGIIPWDDDIDLLVNITCRKQLPEMIKRIAPTLQLYPAGGHDKISHKMSRKTNQYDWRWPYLDLSFFEENRTHIWDHMPTYSYWFVYPKGITLPLHPRPFENLWLPAPRDTLAFLQLTYGNTGTCLTSAYSHIIEDGMRSDRKPCSQLRNTVPFVHRRPCGDKYGSTVSAVKTDILPCVRETLQMSGRILQTKTVAEPPFAINGPYSLNLIRGFTQPPYYPTMSGKDM